MTSVVQYRVSFTALDGSEAEIRGDERALDAIEKAFVRAGIRFNTQIETWDEGFYDSTKSRGE
jgi:hypothetical protein